MSQLLLVEDEKLLRWSLRTRLQNAGYVVDEAATLAEADDQLKRRRPDVVLLDVNLPDGNGLDFLSTQRDKLAESTVLVFTADGRIEDAVLAMKLKPSFSDAWMGVDCENPVWTALVAFTPMVS
jgi:two-component system OmpR family response regulator